MKPKTISRKQNKCLRKPILKSVLKINIYKSLILKSALKINVYESQIHFAQASKMFLKANS